ncbi:hypothetical protein Ddye_029081 [Dipteronia dyeriana]|uniref:Clp R domain-containing protein n=1 Tax=Dipteronia dyeriana TaxID=168575 RepID=A0AAD9WKA0_9ROSI|nr:hypothetical protein Ddye_029081 [Dipteronia dyeriana]
MRAGLCALPQALTSEAASIVKQAINLARRRGHAQVTPLHVASAMLATSTSLLRRACLQSHSHPLQCKALELCFNVALNRLPASTSNPLLGPHHLSPRPSLSNALVAAFKRAQANQRRGSIENQQQPILALKIELEQLIISILDDPSVSRVMREAGFSSSQVRNTVEQDVSLEICSQTSPPPPPPPPPPPVSIHKDDHVMSVLYTLMNQRKNSVIVGLCQADLDMIIRGIMNKFERGLVSAQLISFQLFSLRNHSKHEIEKKLQELRCFVKSCIMGTGVVLYLGDLKWVSEFWSTCSEQQQNRNYYCAVEYMIIMELKRLVFEIDETDHQKLWLIGTSSFQTYLKCKTGQPSLETMWKLNPLTIPVGSLSLGLNLDSDFPSQFTSKVPTCISSNLTLPPWLQQYKEETTRNTIINDQECVEFGDLCKNIRKHSDKVLNFSSHFSWTSSNKQLPKEHNFFVSEISDDDDEEEEEEEEGHESSLIRNYPIQDLLSNPNSSPNSASSSEAEEEEDTDEGLDRLKVFNDENLKILSEALERKVPWQVEVIPEIAKTILQCRSGMKLKQRYHQKEETWLVFLGADHQAKEKIAREIAKVVFGSQSKFASIGMSKFSSKSTEINRNKRAREEWGFDNYVERLGLALNENPHRVFFMEDVDYCNYISQMGDIKKAIKSGSLSLHGGENVPLKDSIIIFSCDSLSSMSRVCSPSTRPKIDDHAHDCNSETKSSSLSLDLNIAIEEHKQEGDITILESVDAQIMFKIQELSGGGHQLL